MQCVALTEHQSTDVQLHLGVASPAVVAHRDKMSSHVIQRDHAIYISTGIYLLAPLPTIHPFLSVLGWDSHYGEIAGQQFMLHRRSSEIWEVEDS